MPEAVAERHPDPAPVFVARNPAVILVPQLTMLGIEFIEWRQQRVGLCAVDIIAVPARAVDTIADDVEAVVQHDALVPVDQVLRRLGKVKVLEQTPEFAVCRQVIGRHPGQQIAVSRYVKAQPVTVQLVVSGAAAKPREVEFRCPTFS